MIAKAIDSDSEAEAVSALHMLRARMKAAKLKSNDIIEPSNKTHKGEAQDKKSFAGWSVDMPLDDHFKSVGIAAAIVHVAPIMVMWGSAVLYAQMWKSKPSARKAAAATALAATTILGAAFIEEKIIMAEWSAAESLFSFKTEISTAQFVINNAKGALRYVISYAEPSRQEPNVLPELAKAKP